MRKTTFLWTSAILAGICLFFNSCKKDEGFHQVSAIERQIHEKVNDYRKTKDLDVLNFQFILFSEARAHSLRMVNGSIDPGYEGLDIVFDDLRNKLGAGNVGAIVELTELNDANNIVNLIREIASKDSVLLGQFNQAGVGFASDKNNLNYITLLFLDIP